MLSEKHIQKKSPHFFWEGILICVCIYFGFIKQTGEPLWGVANLLKRALFLF
jgi:hypothetical protein